MHESFASNYADLERWHWWFVARQTLLREVLRRQLPSTASRPRLASIGCGPPGGLAWMKEVAGEDGVVVGIDADPSGALRAMLAAQAHDPEAKPRAFAIGAAEKLPLRTGKFDAVLMLDVLEHLPDDAQGLVAASQLLRPGGLLLVTVPAGPTLWGQQDVISHHFRRYTRRSLRRAFERAGLAEPRLAYFNSLLYPPIAAIRWGRRLLRRPQDASSDFELARPGKVNDLLRAIMGAERHFFGRVSFPRGVSLLGTLNAP